MRRHKRNIVIAGLVLGLAAIGLIQGPAHADPGGCTDSGPSDERGTNVTPWEPGSGPVPVYLGAEAFAGPTYYGGGLCWILPPGGVYGGNVWTWATVSQDSTGDRTVTTNTGCLSQPGTVSPECSVSSSADTTDDANWNTNGKTTDATVTGSLGGANLGSTGAYVAGPNSSADLPADGDSASSASTGTGSGTCVHVNGGTPTCPLGFTIATMTVQEGDLPTVTPTSSSPPPACTGVNNNCPGAYVTVGGDRGNDTVSGTANGNLPYHCVHVNSICPT